MASTRCWPKKSGVVPTMKFIIMMLYRRFENTLITIISKMWCFWAIVWEERRYEFCRKKPKIDRCHNCCRYCTKGIPNTSTLYWGQKSTNFNTAKSRKDVEAVLSKTWAIPVLFNSLWKVCIGRRKKNCRGVLIYEDWNLNASCWWCPRIRILWRLYYSLSAVKALQGGTDRPIFMSISQMPPWNNR